MIGEARMANTVSGFKGFVISGANFEVTGNVFHGDRRPLGERYRDFCERLNATLQRYGMATV
jgi:hypothetical protein